MNLIICYLVTQLCELSQLEREILLLEIDSALLILLYFGGLPLLYTRGVAP